MTQHSLTADVVKSVDTARQAASDGLANGLDAVRNEAGRIKTAATQGVSDLANQVSQGLKSAGAEADVLIDAAKDQASALQKLIAEELRVHPIRSLGIAAAVGPLAGYLSSR